jgi:hypothetical protein
MKNEILKQNILTKQDFVGMLLDELSNSGYFEDKSYEDIKLIRENTNFDLIQKYCTRDIKTVLDQIKEFENFELDEFEFWFAFDVEGFVNELKNGI